MGTNGKSEYGYKILDFRTVCFLGVPMVLVCRTIFLETLYEVNLIRQKDWMGELVN